MTKKEFKFANGDEVKETVTGFKGTITGTCFYLTGCNQYLIVTKIKDEFSEAVSKWYDEGRLTLVEKEVIKAKDVIGDDKGPDIQAPNKG